MHIGKEEVADFIEKNRGIDVVKQLKKANEAKDKEAFLQALERIKRIIQAEHDIERLHSSIKRHQESIADIAGEIREKKNLIRQEKHG
jgi:hypothetical protein